MSDYSKDMQVDASVEGGYSGYGVSVQASASAGYK